MARPGRTQLDHDATKTKKRSAVEPPDAMAIIIGDGHEYSLIADDPPSQHGPSINLWPEQSLIVS